MLFDLFIPVIKKRVTLKMLELANIGFFSSVFDFHKFVVVKSGRLSFLEATSM